MAATYTVKQVAQILGYSTNSIYTFLKEKRIKGVRVGRGRFRIPQAELDRLLQTPKSQQTSMSPGAALAPPAVLNVLPARASVALPDGVSEPIHEGIVAPALPGHVEVPSLFDWFVGIASVILGLTMFPFSRMFEEFAIDPFLVWLPAVRVMFIAGGFGLLLTDVVGRRMSMWHKAFHMVLIGAYGALGYILWQTGDLEGLVLYGTLAALTLVLVVPMGGIAGFAIYTVSFLALLPAAALGSGTRPTILHMMSLLSIPQDVLAYLWMVGILVFAGILYLGYTHHRKVFWLGEMGVSIILIALSLYYANQIYWDRSLFVLLVGLLSLIMPIWDSFIFTHKRDRSLIFSVFGTILLLFVVVVGIVRVMQTNILQYATNDLGNKAMYGKTYIESTMETAKTALVAASENPLLVEALEEEDEESLVALSRGLFEANKQIRRLLIANRAGDITSTYPYGVVQANNIALRDYFIAATSTGRAQISGVYETQVDNTTKHVVIIAAPVITKAKEVIGVIVGTLNLEAIGNRLQTIASQLNGEYFVVIDSTAKRVVHPDARLIGVEIDEWDDLRLALDGKSGKGEEYNTAGERTILAYTFTDSPRWGIAVKAPITTNLLRVANAAAIAVFGLVILSILAIGFFLLGKKVKTPIQTAEMFRQKADEKKPVPPADDAVTQALSKLKKKRMRTTQGRARRARDDTS